MDTWQKCDTGEDTGLGDQVKSLVRARAVLSSRLASRMYTAVRVLLWPGESCADHHGSITGPGPKLQLKDYGRLKHRAEYSR
jgi:hypothetical protein